MERTRQDILWNELSEESKKFFIGRYNMWDSETDNGRPRRNEYEQVFGSHNLNQRPQIKTWEDVEREHREYKKDVDVMGQTIGFAGPKIFPKLIATYKISKLIELGYGGMVMEEEWKDGNVEKASIVYLPFKENFDLLYNSHRKEFITFHSKKQAEEFMSYPENVELVRQYYLL